MAGRASVELHTLIFFRSRQVVADARVTKVRSTTPQVPAGSAENTHTWWPLLGLGTARPAPAGT